MSVHLRSEPVPVSPWRLLAAVLATVVVMVIADEDQPKTTATHPDILTYPTEEPAP